VFHSQKLIPLAWVFLFAGLLILPIAIGWQHTLAPVLHLAKNQDDFWHGFCYGIGMTLETFAILTLGVTSVLRTQR
jgi:hypothetical protein